MSDLVRMKSLFFDRKSVLEGVDKATRVALSKFGAFVRTRARSSIRTRKEVSAPGSPPSSHTGRLKAGVLFGYDPEARSVIIGPVAYREGSTAPRLLEEGGVSVEGGKRRTYRPRPFMQPAFAAELNQAAPAFKAMIGG